MRGWPSTSRSTCRRCPALAGPRARTGSSPCAISPPGCTGSSATGSSRSPLPVIGFSLGGWLAAEIATVNASLFSKMVLVGAAGLQPEEGQVWDYFVHSSREAFARAFCDPAQAPEYARYYGKVWTPEDEAAGRAEPGDGGPSGLEALHAEPHPARAAARGRHARPWWSGGARTPSSRSTCASVRARDTRGDREGAGPVRPPAGDGAARRLRAGGARLPRARA